jgi:hypothetical protein
MPFGQGVRDWSRELLERLNEILQWGEVCMLYVSAPLLFCFAQNLFPLPWFGCQSKRVLTARQCQSIEPVPVDPQCHVLQFKVQLHFREYLLSPNLSSDWLASGPTLTLLLNTKNPILALWKRNRFSNNIKAPDLRFFFYFEILWSAILFSNKISKIRPF